MSLPSILVVDDSPSLRRMIGACLRTGGFDVTEAADGDQAHALALAGNFGMLVTDQVMPGIDGLTLIRSLRATERYARLPILMLTTEQNARCAGGLAGRQRAQTDTGTWTTHGASLRLANPAGQRWEASPNQRFSGISDGPEVGLSCAPQVAV